MVDNTPISQMTAAQFEETFPHEEACCAYLVAKRWPEGVCCPRCGSDRVYRLKTMKWKWRCPACGKGGAYHFSHTAGTVLENTKIPLLSWFRFLRLILTCKESMSAPQVQRHMGLTSYKTAWHMCQRARAVLQDEYFRKLMGIVAVDETFIAEFAISQYEDVRAAPFSGLEASTGASSAVLPTSRLHNIADRT